MKYLHHLFLVIGAFAVPISTQTTKFFTQQALNKNFSLDTPVYSSCGGVLNDSLAAITYESVETIHTYERCVWTIRSSGAAGYSLDVLSFGLEVNPDNTGIIASCLNANDIQLIQTSVDKLGAVNLTENCPVLIITFYSTSYTGNQLGFVLLYTAIPGVSNVSDSSRHHILQGSEGHVRHPVNATDDYTPNDLSTFVILPTNNTYSLGKKQHVTYLREELGDVPQTCGPGSFAKIRLHRFTPSTGWSHQTSAGNDLLCAGVEYKKWESEDILMVVFKTFAGNTGKGFHLMHTNSTC